MTPNSLLGWINLYKQTMGHPMGGGTGFYDAMNNANYNGAALSFAQAMAGQEDGPGQGELPDYFSKVPSNTNAPMAPQQGYNRLAALMGRRY